MERDGEVELPGLGIAAWVTDVGHVRGRNEDRLLLKSLWGGEYAIVLVADGAGGHDSGDKAAEEVIAAFSAAFPDQGALPGGGDPSQWVRDAIMQAHTRVKALGKGQSRPPASTVVGLLVERASLCGWRFHVGDSRLYVRGVDGMVAQWTRDHNITNGLIDRGLPVTQALKIADGGRLTQVLGGMTDPEPEILGPLALGQGQVFLLCSDGIYGHNGDREVLLPAMNPALGSVRDRLRELKTAVLEGEAPDNLTAILWQVPDQAVATRERETVTNSMRAISAADIEKHSEEQKRTQPGPRRVAGTSQAEPARGPLLLVVALLGVLLLLYAVFWKDMGSSPGPADGTGTVTPAPASSPPPEPLPWPADPDLAAKLQIVVGGFDAEWWSGLPRARREEVVGLLSELGVADTASDVTLAWSENPDGPPLSTEYDGWSMPGGANADLAARAWAARSRLLAQEPELARQPGVDGLLADAACQQLAIRWPRVDGAPPIGPGELAAWLDACLPVGDPSRRTTVRLGGWPDRGWTLDEMNVVRYLASKAEGGAELLQLDAAESPRVLELGLLARALREPATARVVVEIRVVLAACDLPPQTRPEEAPLLARVRAVEMATLVRSATGGRSDVRGEGSAGDPLAVPSPGSAPTSEQAARLADLDRRVEVTAWSVAPEEELPGQPEGEPAEAELPGEPTTDAELPGAPTDEAALLREASPGGSGLAAPPRAAPGSASPPATTPGAGPGEARPASPTAAPAASPSPSPSAAPTPAADVAGPPLPVLVAPSPSPSPAGGQAEPSPAPGGAPAGSNSPTPLLDLSGMR